MMNDGSFCFNNCTGFCCSKYTVVIGTEDIIRILSNTPLKAEHFLILYEANHETFKIFPKIHINSTEVIIGLKTRSDGSCVFFLNELGMCGIHLYKPRVCHTYPFTMNAESELIRHENVFCPGEWLPKDTNDLKDCIRQAWQEMKISETKINNWNTKNSDGTFQDFIDFIQR